MSGFVLSPAAQTALENIWDYTLERWGADQAETCLRLIHQACDETETSMALTKSFKELVQKRVAADPAFAAALLREGIDSMLSGDVDSGKMILRDYIKATVGFEKLGEAVGTQPKSLIRMFSPRGNPQARNLFGIIFYLQRQAGVQLHVTQAPH